MSNEAQLIKELAEESPGAARLAPLVSLAVLVEPRLLRRARITLLADVEAGAEADLWLSPLVQARSPRGIVLKPRAAELLRRELAKDATLFRKASDLTAEMHRASAPTILLEEEIKRLSVNLEGESLGRVERLLHTITNTLLREEGRRGLANWAASALARFPEGVRRLEAARVLAAVAYLRLSSHLPPQGESPGERLPEWLSWALPKEVPPLDLGVRLVEGGVQFGDPPEPGRSISVPGTNPLVVELAWAEDGRERVRQVRLARGERLKVEAPQGAVRLRTALGERYVITPNRAAGAAQPGEDAAERPTCFVVMGFGKKTDFETGRTLDLDKTYHNIIKPAVRAAGLECVRADEIPHSGVIDVPMYEQIFKADLVIADLSTSNANALYELGVRHGLRPYSTIIISEDGLKYFPWDSSHISVRQYHHSGDWIDYEEVERFRSLLGEAITAIYYREPRETDSPVYAFIEGLVPPALDESIDAASEVAAPSSPSSEAPGGVLLSEMMEQVTEAQEAGDFETAKALLNLLRRRRRGFAPDRPDDPDLIRRLALVTYESRQPDPESALQEARGLLAELDPATTNDTETLLLWGEVHERLWGLTKDGRREEAVRHLNEAVRAYERGFSLRNDHRSGINLAFLLNARAAARTGSPAEAIADFVRAGTVRREVIAVCERDSNNPALSTSDRAELTAALAEAYFGSGEPEIAERYYGELHQAAPSEAAKAADAFERRARLEGLLATSPLRFLKADAE